MGIPKPWDKPQHAPAGPPDEDPNWVSESESERVSERAHAREAGRPGGGDTVDGQVLPFPDTGTEVAQRDAGAELEATRTPALTRAHDLGGRWWAEAAETGTAALDGAVWRARPPALRDIHARVVRAEWAGDVPALRVAGRVYGHVAMAGVALLYGAAWLLARPARLAIAALTVLITALLV